MNAKTRYSIMTLAAVAAIALPGCQEDQRDGSAWIGQHKRMNSPDTRKADPSEPMSDEILPETFVAAGRLHESHHRLARAAQQYRLAIGRDATNIEAHNRLGIVLDKLGRYGEADEAFLKAIELAPDKAYLHNNLGFSYTLQQRWDEAEQALRRALEIQPDFARARVNLGMCLAHLDRWSEALYQFELAIPRENAYYNLGLLYQSKRRLDDAASAYRTALVLNPDFTAAKKRFDMLPPQARAGAEEFHIVAGSPASGNLTITSHTSPTTGQPAAKRPASSIEPAPVTRTSSEGESGMQVLSARPIVTDPDPAPQFDPLAEDTPSSTEQDTAEESPYAMMPTEEPATPPSESREDAPPPNQDDWMTYDPDEPGESPQEQQEDETEATSTTRPAESATNATVMPGDGLASDWVSLLTDRVHGQGFLPATERMAMLPEAASATSHVWKTYDHHR